MKNAPINKSVRIPPEELNFDPYTQDDMRAIVRRGLEHMWLSGKAEILKGITEDLCKRAEQDHW